MSYLLCRKYLSTSSNQKYIFIFTELVENLVLKAMCIRQESGGCPELSTCSSNIKLYASVTNLEDTLNCPLVNPAWPSSEI